MVGRQHCHQRIVFRSVTNVKGGKRDCRSRVASDRFNKNMFARSLRQLPARLGGLFSVRNRPDAIRWNDWPQPRHRLLQHRARTSNIQ
jgi:hypothetical protein